MAEIGDLDTTDANNTGRWPENMAFSSVNDSGRAMEGYLARWFQDTNGSIAASGSSNAFAITSKRTISTLANNIVMAFTANHTITGAATLNLNGLGAKSIKRFNGNDLTAGDIVSGQPVWVIYKSADDDWFMISAAAALFANMHADFNENASPGDPAANTARLYAKDDGAGTTIMAYRDNAGVESHVPGVASQAEMEAASSLIKASSPGRQHFHPVHPKAGGKVDGDGNIEASFGVASVSRDSAGVYDVTLSTAMADTNYWVLVTAAEFDRFYNAAPTSTTVFRVTGRSSGGTISDAGFGFAVFGDQ